MNIQPKISIIIPTFNRCQLLKRAIESVFNQTYANLELIIVDDASTDDTAIFVQTLSDERIKYIKHKNNQGGSVARNTGIALATGEYICFSDDDDEIHPQKLQKQINKFQESSTVGVVYSGWQYVYGGKRIFKYFPKLKGQVFQDVLKGIMVISTPLIKSECFNKVGNFDPLFRSCQDWDIWIRIAKYYEFDYVPDILTTYHIHGDQVSSNLQNKILSRERLIIKHEIDFRKFPNIYSDQFGRLGALCYLNREQVKGRELIFKAINVSPWRLKNYLYIVLLIVDFFFKGIFEYFVVERRGSLKLYY